MAAASGEAAADELVAAESHEAAVDEFVAVTGESRDAARGYLQPHGFDVVDALEAFYSPAAEHESDDDEPPHVEPARAAAAQLPTAPPADLVESILASARAEVPPAAPNNFNGPGRALNSSEESQSPPSNAGLPPMDRKNAKKVCVIFWADGFTVEDVTEQEAAAATPQPRKTGIATLSSGSSSAAGMRTMPPLRKYEEHQAFMQDLKNGLPPVEFREMDMSSGVLVGPL